MAIDYALLRQFYLFAKADAALLQEVATQLHCRQYRAGQYLFQLRQPANHTFLIVQGQVKVYRWTPEGEEKLFHRLGAGQMVAEAAMFMTHGFYPMYARAEQATRVYVMERQYLQQLCQRHPTLAMLLLEKMGERLFSMVQRIDQLSANSAGRRLASWLADRCPSQQGLQHVCFSRQQLAIQLGVAPETLSRLLHKYRRAGFLHGARGQWQILDLDGLLTMEGLPARQNEAT